MYLKKIIAICIALMILTPSFSFALETDPSGSSSGSISTSGSSSDSSSSSDSFSSESNSAEKSDPMIKNADNFDDSNQSLDSLENENQQESEENEEPEIQGIQMMAASITTETPEMDTASLTASQSPDLNFPNDAYLTSLFSGAAVYKYPIQAPKGINNFQPKIELIYNSHKVGGHYGWLGDGWSLNEHYILRDVMFTPTNISDDQFKLVFEGQMHNLIYDNESGFYHTEIETYMRIQKLENGENQKGEYWVIHTKDGIEYRLGYTEDSELMNSVTGRNYVSKWKLDKIEDRNGNSILYNYVKNPVNGEIGTSYLSNITYNDGTTRIEFERANKPITFNGFHDGSRISEKSLLKNIIIVENENVIFEHLIQYNTSNNHILLNNITRKDSNSLEDIPVVFSYGSIQGFVRDNTSFPGTPNINGYNQTIMDINGDGLQDFVYSSYVKVDIPQYKHSVRINTGEGFVLENQTIPGIPELTYYYDQRNENIMKSREYDILDINGDGLTDIVSSGSTVWINNGSSFIKETTFSGRPASVSKDHYRMFDVNGDGLIDYVYGGIVWVNTGNEFIRDNTSFPGTPNINGYNQTIMDINGDGLLDIVYSSYVKVDTPQYKHSVRINTGEGFVLENQTFPGIPELTYYYDQRNENVMKSREHDILDINGDGLPDIVSGGNTVWINNGSGFVKNDTTFTGRPASVSKDNYRWLDVNGDGLMDYVYKGEVWVNSPNSFPNLLNQITHSSGSVTTIEYETSAKFNNTKEDGKQGLPTAINIVKKVEIDNGMADDHHTTSTYVYDYKGGFMHVEPKGKTEFRGFRQVTVNDGRSTMEHYFHQDQAKKGNEYKTVVKSVQGDIYSITENEFSSVETNGIFEVIMTNSTQSIYDGLSTPVVSKTYYEYDMYGNPIEIRREGDISITGDERTVRLEYIYNTDDWILNKVKKESLEGMYSQKIAKSDFYYDGNADLNATPTRGLMTKTVAWNSHGNDVIQDYEYDSYGNLIAKYDGNGHLTTMEYGSFPVYPVSFTNAKGQTTFLEYNSIGKITKVTDSNGFETIKEYDGFGRITKVIKPGDSSGSPTIEYRYYIDGTAPEYVQILVKETENQYYDTWKYYDGLTRIIKTEAESENVLENIIQETYYDNFGGASKVVAPRKSFEPCLNTTNDFDAFGRLLQITNPDGTSKTIEYQQLKITTFDERGNKIQMDKDIYGNIVKVTEFNGADVYETRYEYNAVDKLIKIIPNQYYDQSNVSFLVENGNAVSGGLENTTTLRMDLSSLGIGTPINTAYKVENTTFDYDSLGRLVKLDDPDLGVWQYGYNANGKKISEKDSRGITIFYDYDALNRIVLIDYPNDDDVIYEYDDGTIGTLSKVSSGAVTKSYSYDDRLRIVEEVVSIEGAGNSDPLDGNTDVGEPLPEINGSFANKQNITLQLEEEGYRVQKVDLTNLRVSMGAGDSGSIYLNNRQILKFVDSGTGGDLYIYDENGTQLGSIARINGKKTAQNMTFDVSFIHDGSEMRIEIQKYSINIPAGTFNYSYLTNEDILTLRAYLVGYQSNVDYISSEYAAEYEMLPSLGPSMEGSFVNQEDITLQFKKEDYRVQRVDLTNLRVSMGAGDSGYIYLNNHPTLKFVDSNIGGTLFVYDENGAQVGSIIQTNGKLGAGDITYSISFIHNGSKMIIEIQRYTMGLRNDFFNFSYMTDEDIVALQAHFVGYQSNVDYISSEYAVEYEMLPSPGTDRNGFIVNRGDITLQLEEEGYRIQGIDLTDLRASMGAGDSGYIYLNNHNILKFVDSSSGGNLYIYDENGTQLGNIAKINGKPTYENMTFDVSFIRSGSEMVVEIQKYNRSVPNGTFSYSYSTNEDISTLRAYMIGYQSNVDYISSQYTVKYKSNASENNIPSDFITLYSYDSMDRIVQKTLPNGKVISYNYNDQALLSSIPGVIDNIEYNSMNLMTRKEFSNNVATDLTYDGWTKRLENIDTPGLQNINYAFDPKGNIVGIADNIVGENQYFFYDDLDRLILAGSENYSQSFAYNPLGSVLAHRNKDMTANDEIIFGFEYGKNAGIHAPTRVGDAELLYDANGNLIEDSSFVYVYNDANRLTEVLKKAENNRSVAEFVYDENGKRVVKTENGVVSYYISSDYDIEDGEETVYYFANGNRVAKESSEGMFWYLDDHLGSTDVMIDESGQLVERTSYYPFGGHREGGTEKYSFTGKEFDSEIGLYYFEARYYNPETFVFTQADSVIPSLYNPQTLNRYSYCYNNPIMYIDANGHWGIGVHLFDTYGWARDVGFTPIEAVIIGAGSQYVDMNAITMPKIEIEGTYICGDKSYHINMNSSNEDDSRMAHSEQWYNDSVELWNQPNTNRNTNIDMKYDLISGSNQLFGGQSLATNEIDSLFCLGQSLHPLQDISSHGNIPGHSMKEKYDRKNYDWADDSRTSVVKSKDKQGQRWNEAQTETKNRLRVYLRATRA